MGQVQHDGGAAIVLSKQEGSDEQRASCTAETSTTLRVTGYVLRYSKNATDIFVVFYNDSARFLTRTDHT